MVAGLVLAASALSAALVVADLGTTQSARRVARDGSDGIGLPVAAEPGTVVRSTRSFTTDEGVVTLIRLGGPAAAPVGLPGLDRLPPIGSVLVSTDRAGRIADGELRSWLAGPVTGPLPASATVDPDEEVVVAVVDPREITARGEYSVIDPDRTATAPPADGDDLLAVVGAIVVLVPLAALAATAVRVTGRRKEQRDATLRLLGLTPRGLRCLVVLETLAASTIAAIVGFGAVAAAIAVTERVRIAGRSAWSSDLRLDPADALVVLLGTAVVAIAAALLGTRGAEVDPVATQRAASADSIGWTRLAWCAAPTTVLLGLWLSSPTEPQAVAGTATALLLGTVAVARTGPLATRTVAAVPRGLGGRLGAAPLLRRAQQASRPVVPVALVLFGFAVAMTLLPGMAAGDDVGIGGADLVVRATDVDLAPVVDELAGTPGVDAVAAIGDAVVAVDGRTTAVAFVGACRDLALLGVRIVDGSCRSGAALSPAGDARSTLTFAADPGAMVAERATVYGTRDVSGAVAPVGGGEGDDLVVVVDPAVETNQRRALVRTDRRPVTLAAIRDLVADDPALSLLDREAQRLAERRSGQRAADQIATVAGGLLGLGAVGTAYAGWGVALDRRRDHVTLRAIGIRRHEVALAGLVSFLAPVLAVGLLAATLGLTVGLVGAHAAGVQVDAAPGDVGRGLLVSAAVIAATAAALATSAARLPPEPP